MIQIEEHLLKKDTPEFREADYLCNLSRLLYNRTIKAIREYYYNNSSYKTDRGLIYHYAALEKLLKDDPCYRVNGIPVRPFKEVFKQVHEAYKAFIGLKKTYDKTPNLLTGEPKRPKTKHKRNVITYPKEALSFCKKPGYIHLSQTQIYIKTDLTKEEVKEVSIVPTASGYNVVVVYDKPCSPLVVSNKYSGIDLGVKNLAVLSSNDPSIKPVLITGGAIRYMNECYYEERQRLRRELPAGQKSSHRLRKLAEKHRRKMKNYLHVMSRRIVDWHVANGISVIVIGKNTGWKTGMDMGRVNNRTFGSIAHSTLIQMITYKAQLLGIQVATINESYTSKCSFLDMEPITKRSAYIGERDGRDLFISGSGLIINADLNGSLNILRKYFGDVVFAAPVMDYAVPPVRWK